MGYFPLDTYNIYLEQCRDSNLQLEHDVFPLKIQRNSALVNRKRTRKKLFSSQFINGEATTNRDLIQ